MCFPIWLKRIKAKKIFEENIDKIEIHISDNGGGIPENIIDKIPIGKMNKFYEENCLLQQKFVKDDKTTVEKFANPMKLNGFERFKVGEGIEKKEEDFAAEVANQIG